MSDSMDGSTIISQRNRLSVLYRGYETLRFLPRSALHYESLYQWLSLLGPARPGPLHQVSRQAHGEGESDKCPGC